MYHEEPKVCGTEADFAIVDPALRDEVLRAQRAAKEVDGEFSEQGFVAPGAALRLAQNIYQIAKRIHSAPDIVADCPFDGDVDVYPLRGGATSWTCPLCGTEHVDTPD